MPAGAPRPFENTVNTFGQNQTEQSYGVGSENQNQTFGQENNHSTQWGLNNAPLEQNNNNTLSSNLFGNNNLFNQNQSVWNKNQYQTLAPSRYNLKDLTDRLQQYQNNALGNSNSSLNSGLNNGSIFSPNNMQSLNLNASSALYPQQNSFSTYSQPYQLAQNTTPNMVSDVGNISSGNFSPEVLKERMLPVIKDKEKPLDYIYIDTTWNKTTGAGANVDDWDTFNQINWMVNGRPATEAEKRAAFDYFDSITSKGKQNVDEKGNLIKKNNNKADAYRNKSQLRISFNEIDRLLRNHITEDIKYLQKEFPDFASYPPELQNVLLDIKFNTGNVSQENWPKLRKAIAEKNLFGKDGIIYNVHRKDVGEDRNYWTEQQIRNIKSW